MDMVSFLGFCGYSDTDGLVVFFNWMISVDSFSIEKSEFQTCVIWSEKNMGLREI